MKMQKFLASIIAGAMIAGVVPFTVSATETDKWDGTYSREWLKDGNPEGTSGDKFYLESAAELADFAKYVNTYASTNNIFLGDTVYLTVNVDLCNLDWDPIGTALPREKNRFYGSFDGQGHTISNLKVAEGHYHAGLFGQIPTYNYSQTFLNLTIHNAYVVAEDETSKNKEAAGVLIGRANGAIIDNCHVTGEIYVSGDRFVGGLIGHSYAQMSNCSVEASGTINADTWQAGGILGAHGATASYTSSIENCSVIGDKANGGLAVKSYYASAGGLAGAVSLSGVSDTTIDGITVKNVTVSATSADYGSGVDEVASGYEATNTTVDNVSVGLSVAKIGNTYFTTLKEAIKAAQENDTIYLSGTIEEGAIKLPAVIKNLTIDGQGTAVVKNTTINAADGGSVNYQGLTIKNTTFDNSRFVLGGQRAGDVIYKDLVFDGNTFKNIVNTSSLAAVHMNIASEDNEYIENFKFINNTIDGVTGSSNSGVLIKSAKGDVIFEGNTISNVVNNAIQCINAKSDINLVIKNNNLSSDLGSVLNLYNVPAVTLENNTITLNEGQKALGNFAKAAAIGNSYYTSLQAALAAAKDGDTITLASDAVLENANIKKDIVIDLNGKTLDLNAVATMDSASGASAAVQAWADVEIKNGNINVTSAAKINNGIFYVAGKADAALTLNSVNLTAENTNGTDVFVSCEPGTLTIADSVINATGVSKLVNGGDGGNATITGTKVNVTDSDRVMVNVALTANDSDFVVTNLSDNAFRNISGTLNNTNIDANGYANGIKNDAGLNLDVLGDSVITLTGGTEYDLYLKDGATLTVADTAKVEADNVYVAKDDAVDGDMASKADTVYIQYKKTDIDGDVDTLEGSDTYDIVLTGADKETIHELASADITFNFVGTPVGDGAMSYTVLPKEGVTLTQIENRYMFNYDGIKLYEETANAIVIGTLTIDGFGKYTLQTAVADTNAVYATEIRDNIVDGFTPAAGLEINKDMVADDGMVGEIIDAEIAVPERELTINITFPNAVEYQAADYQDMKVTIVGGNIDEEIALGNNAADYTIVRELPYNSTYTVTVSGAGYRTARYSVTLTEDKTLNFWNNVMDNALEVEEGKATSAVVKNFLAGDIVKDNNINIYDLSAVVSYFGTENCVADHPDYAKYDLNRDGVIDSKDVAYVLVSWGE